MSKNESLQKRKRSKRSLQQPRREEPPSTGGSNEHVQVHEVQTETLIDYREEDIVASAMIRLS